MSIRLIENEIHRSLATREPEVICIKGYWGVGKTFAWNRYLEQARNRKNGIALKHYAYVSLFGITSLVSKSGVSSSFRVKSGEIRCQFVFSR